MEQRIVVRGSLRDPTHIELDEPVTALHGVVEVVLRPVPAAAPSPPVSSVAPPGGEAGVEARFAALAAQWIEETHGASSFTEIVGHPAYREIVEMGPAVVPSILRDLEREPKHWGPALGAITGAQPVPKEHAGRVKKIAEDWLQWARDHGYAWAPG